MCRCIRTLQLQQVAAIDGMCGESIRCADHSLDLGVTDSTMGLPRHSSGRWYSELEWETLNRKDRKTAKSDSVNTLLAEVLKACKDVVNYGRNSTHMKAEIRKAFEDLDSDYQVLIQDVVTRWSSKQKMCVRLTTTEASNLGPSFSDHGIWEELKSMFRLHPQPTKQAWEFTKLSFTNFHMVKRATVLWHPVEAVSIALEGEQYPTLSLVLVFFYGLLQLLRLDLNLHLGNIELCVDAAHVGEEYPFNCAGVQPMDAMEDEDVERGECKFCIEADTHLPVQYKDSLLTFRADLIQAIGYRFRTLVANSAVLLAAALDPRTKELSFASATEKPSQKRLQHCLARPSAPAVRLLVKKQSHRMCRLPCHLLRT